MSIIFSPSILASSLPLWSPSIVANLSSPALAAAAHIDKKRSEYTNGTLRPLVSRRNINGPTLAVGLANARGLIPINLVLGDWQNCLCAGWLLRSVVRQSLLTLSLSSKSQVVYSQPPLEEIAPAPQDVGSAKNMLLVKRPARIVKPDPQVLVAMFHDLKINDAVCKAIWLRLSVSPHCLDFDLSVFPAPKAQASPTIGIELVLLLISRVSSLLLLESGTGSITEVVSEDGPSMDLATDISTSSEPTLVSDTLFATQPLKGSGSDVEVFNDNSMVIPLISIVKRMFPACLDNSSEEPMFDSPVPSPTRSLNPMATVFVPPSIGDFLTSGLPPSTGASDIETPKTPAKLTRRAKKRLLKLRLAQMALDASASCPESDLAAPGTSTVQSTQPDVVPEETVTSSNISQASPVHLNPLATEFVPPTARAPPSPQDPEDQVIVQVPQKPAKMSRGAKRRLAKRLQSQTSLEAHPPLNGNDPSLSTPTAHTDFTPANIHGYPHPSTHAAGTSPYPSGPVSHDHYVTPAHFPFNAVPMNGYSAHNDSIHTLMPHTPPFQAPMPPSGYQDPYYYSMISPPYDCRPNAYLEPSPAYGY